MWCQEEPLNAGAWAYVRPRLETMLAAKASGASPASPSPPSTPRSVRYVGRRPSAAPATGLREIHQLEINHILDEVFGDTGR